MIITTKATPKNKLTENQKAKLREIFGGCKSLSITTPARVEIILYTEADVEKVEAKVRKALVAGHEVMRDGSRIFMDHREVLDTSRNGAAMYTWDKSGDRVLHERVIHTVQRDGTHTEKIIGTCYRVPS